MYGHQVELQILNPNLRRKLLSKFVEYKLVNILKEINSKRMLSFQKELPSEANRHLNRFWKCTFAENEGLIIRNF